MAIPGSSMGSENETDQDGVDGAPSRTGGVLRRAEDMVSFAQHYKYRPLTKERMPPKSSGKCGSNWLDQPAIRTFSRRYRVQSGALDRVLSV